MKGFLDKVTQQAVTGWAHDPAISSPIEVCLEVDGEIIARTRADNHRPAMKEMQLHPTGYCGFSFDLPKLGIQLKPSCVVRALGGQGKADLWNSPWPYRHPVMVGQQIVPMSRKRLAGEQFFFIHIPKTAGSSFGQMLSEVFTKEFCYANREDRKQHDSFFPSHNEYLMLTPEKLEKMQLMMGHIPYCMGQILPKRVQYLTFLRDPMERVISNLFYLHQNFPLYRGLSVEQIFHLCKDHHFKNLQVRYFADTNPWDLQYFRHLGSLNAEVMETARKNLDQCQFIGLTEQFDDSVALANQLFGWNLKNIKRLNITSNKNLDKLPRKIVEELEDLIRFDLEFYTYAKEKFEARRLALVDHSIN